MSVFRKSCRWFRILSTHMVGAKGNSSLHIRKIYTSNVFRARISFNLTDIGEGIREVVVREWFVKIGDKVSQFDNICEVQSDKASVTITSRYDGIIKKLHYNVDGIAFVGKPLVDIEIEGGEDSSGNCNSDSTDNDDTREQHRTEENLLPHSYKQTLCIPSVRRIAKESNIDLSKVRGTGKDGRILKEDVLNFLKMPKFCLEAVTTTVTATDKDRTENITGFRKVMVKTMTDALKIPHFVYCEQIMVTKLNRLRAAVKSNMLNEGVKLTVLPFFAKAVSNALHKYPVLNTSVDLNCENITYKGAHNIGIAMDTAKGLAVPVIKNVQDLSIIEISKELNRMMMSGKEGSFHPNDLAGGTITISNVGPIGGTYTAPVILTPQVAILALGRIQVLPRFDTSGNVVPEETINLSASADHRIIDGATLARFVALLKEQLENPYLIFLNK